MTLKELKKKWETMMTNKIYPQEQVRESTLEYFKGDELATSVWMNKYALKNDEGEFLEQTPDDMHIRLAKEFERIEGKYDNPMSFREIYDMFAGFKYVVPQGSPMSGIGNERQIQSISNCFVIDSPEDSYGGILKADQEEVQIMKRRGGVGFDISTIRPKGMTTSNAAQTTDGIEVFMDRFSNSCREVAQGGRRGALMLSISVHHPQVMDFIKIKRDLTRVTGANISVRVSDEFMKAVKENTEYIQRWPVDSKTPEVHQHVNACEVWNALIEGAHASAEPGVLFWDTATRMTPSDAYSDVGFGSVSTNPCVTGDTLVMTNTGVKTVKELADKNEKFLVQSLNTITFENEFKTAIAFKTKENAKIMRIVLDSGKEIRLTPDHRVYTDHGWVEAKDIGVIHKIKTLESFEKWTSIIAMEEREDVYDLTVEDNHNFFANELLVHNCGEIILSPYDSCRLMLMNLTSFVDNAWTEKASFDWGKFRTISRKAQRLMDDMIDLEIEQIDKILAKIDSDPEHEVTKTPERNLWQTIRNVAKSGRRTGLGVTGLGDAIAMLGQRYGDDKSIETVEEIYKWLSLASYEESIQLAKERGAFPVFNISKEEGHEFLSRVTSSLTEEVQADYRKYGRRNIANTTTAPAGSVSCLTQTTSGIEPAFMLYYKRRKKAVNGEKVTFIDDMGDQWTEFNVYHHGFKQWLDSDHGTTAFVDDLDHAVTFSPYHGATANEIDWKAKVKLQAAAQKWICHAISNTTNLPSDVTVETVKDIYMLGWELGCKGVTVYRDGSRSGVLVSTEDKGKKDTQAFSDRHAPKRPEILECDIMHTSVKMDQWVVLVGLMDGKPYEIFGGKTENIEIPKKYKTGKLQKRSWKTKDSQYDLVMGEGDEQMVIKDVVSVFNNANYAGYTRTISLALRHGAPVQYLVEQMQKDKEADMFSFSKAIARCLKKYIKDGTIASDKDCKDCGATGSMVYQDGCSMCSSCGMSKCT